MPLNLKEKLTNSFQKLKDSTTLDEKASSLLKPISNTFKPANLQAYKQNLSLPNLSNTFSNFGSKLDFNLRSLPQNPVSSYYEGKIRQPYMQAKQMETSSNPWERRVFGPLSAAYAGFSATPLGVATNTAETGIASLLQTARQSDSSQPAFGGARNLYRSFNRNLADMNTGVGTTGLGLQGNTGMVADFLLDPDSLAANAPKLAKITGADNLLKAVGKQTFFNNKTAKQIANIQDKIKRGRDTIEDANEIYRLAKEHLPEGDIKKYNYKQLAEQLSIMLNQDQRVAYQQIPGKMSLAGDAQPTKGDIGLPRKADGSIDRTKLEGPQLDKTNRQLEQTINLKRGGGDDGVMVKNPQFDFKNWKDKRKGILGLERETMGRNLEDVAGKESGKVKKFLLEPLRKNDQARVEWLNNTREQVEKTVKDFGIKRGSKDDALVQRYGEGRISVPDLKQETDNWENVTKAAEYFRELYDDFLNRVNATRTAYGYAPIPKRKDYFRHFQEIGFASQISGIFTNKDSLPTEIAGLTDIFSPGKPFSTIELQRKGGPFTESAIKGMDDYLDSASRQMFHIDSVQRGRALEKMIREAAKNDKDVELPAFVANLHEWTNIVSGKKTRFDRAFEDVSGRELYRLANTLRARTSANMVGANVSSALTNFIPLTQSFATTRKDAALAGLLKGVTTALEDDFRKIDGTQSRFLTRRFKKESIDPRGLDKAKDVANWLFESVDKFTSRSIVSGKFYEGIKNGLSPKQAMNQADDYAVRLMAQREIGELPNLINSRALGFITQFQTEVNNQASFLLKDIPNMNEKKALKTAWAMAQVAIFSHVYNNIAEKLTGRRAATDPIQYAMTMAGMTDNEDDNLAQRLQSVGGDVVNDIPFIGTRLPISGALPDAGNVVRGAGYIAEGDTEKGLKTLGKEATKPLAYLAPPFGGGQVKKTLEGLMATNKGYSETTSGRVRYPVEQSPQNVARSALFGQYAVPEAREYFNKGRSILGENQSELFKQATNKRELYDKIMSSREMKNQEDEIREQVREGNQSQYAGTKLIYFNSTSDQVESIDIGKVATMPENSNLAKELKKKEVWKATNKVMKADITPEQKQQALEALGVKPEEATYYSIATYDTDLKMAYLKDVLPRFQGNREAMLQTLAMMRGEVNGERILQDNMIDQLYNDGVIGANEKSMLKGLKYKDGKISRKSGKGKKIKVPSLISTSQLLTAFNNYIKAKTAMLKSSPSRNLSDLYAKRRQRIQNIL